MSMGRMIIIGVTLAAVLAFFAPDKTVVIKSEEVQKRQQTKPIPKKKAQKKSDAQKMGNDTKESKFEKWKRGIPQAVRFIEKHHGKRIQIAASQHQRSKDLITTIVVVESNGNPKAKGKNGEIGLMQIKPQTAREVGADPKYLKDPYYNLLIGAKYLKRLEKHYGFKDINQQAIAFNLGPSGAETFLKHHHPQNYMYVKKTRAVLAYLRVQKNK